MEENIEQKITTESIVAVISKSTRSDLGNNKQNKKAVSKAIEEAVEQDQLRLWRYVCIPRITIENNEWNLQFGDPRYDTLTQALSFDKDLISKLRAEGIEPTITFVLNDWEIIYLRNKQQFEALGSATQQRLVQELKQVQERISAWITTEAATSLGSAQFDIQYFTDIIDPIVFEELMLAMVIEESEETMGILRSELDFIRKAGDVLTEEQALRMAMRRVAQYAVEGSVLQDWFGLGSLFLCSEYPIASVWKKINLLTTVPTIFYVNDRDVRNI